MKIAIDIRDIGRKKTGGETVFLNLVKELVRIDSENSYFLCLDTRSGEELSEIKGRLGIEGKKNFLLCPLGGENRFVWTAWLIPKFVRAMKIDVYHTQYIVPFFIPKSVKIVTHIHDVSFRAYPELIAWKDRFFLYMLIPRSLRRADAIIAVSEFTRSEIKRWYGKKAYQKTHTVLNGIVRRKRDARILTEEDVQRLRKKYNLPRNFFLSVGTLQPRKNIPLLLEAFDEIAAQVNDMSLVLTGDLHGHNVDPKIELVLKTLPNKDCIIFSGYIDEKDLAGVYRLSRALVFASKYEGFGLPIGEALDLGVTVLASDIPAHHEVAGNNVQYFAPESLAELSELLYSESIRGERLYLRRPPISLLPRWKNSAKKILAIYKSSI